MSKATSSSSIDFLGIGAQKTSNAWLFHRLAELPEFAMPYEIEFHHFDKGSRYHNVGQDNLANLIKNALLFRSQKAGRLLSALIKMDFHRLFWLMKFNFLPDSDQKYLSLFQSFNGISGELTPDYSILYEDDIARMHQLLPDIKLLFIIRNPIERAWFHFRFFYVKRKVETLQEDKLDPAKVFEFIQSEYQQLRTDYLRTLRLYTKYYRPEQILVGFYDAMTEQPVDLLEKIVDFLGGDPNGVRRHCNVSEPISGWPKVAIPHPIAVELARMYYPMTEELSRLFGGYCTRWLQELNAIDGKSLDNGQITDCPSAVFLNNLSW